MLRKNHQVQNTADAPDAHQYGPTDSKDTDVDWVQITCFNHEIDNCKKELRSNESLTISFTPITIFIYPRLNTDYVTFYVNVIHHVHLAKILFYSSSFQTNTSAPTRQPYHKEKESIIWLRKTAKRRWTEFYWGERFSKGSIEKQFVLKQYISDLPINMLLVKRRYLHLFQHPINIMGIIQVVQLRTALRYFI